MPIPGNPLPYAAAKRPPTKVALLPVEADDVALQSFALSFFGEDQPTEDAGSWSAADDADGLNDILNTLAAGQANTLVGPKKQQTILKELPDWGELFARLERTEPVEAVAHDELRGWAGKLGATHLIRILARVEVHHHGGHTFGIACPGVPWVPLILYNWHGTVAVTAQLWDAEQGCIVGSRTAESGFWGSVANLPCIFVGHAVWKTFGRGGDEALRRVLDELLLAAERSNE